MFDRNRPYNDLPPIPAAERLETARTLKAAIPANRVLAELKAGGDLIPNQAVLLRAILLQEARASSEIENVVTSNDALYRALDQRPEAADPRTREVLRYGEALWAGYRDLREGRPIRPSLLIDLARRIKGADTDVRPGEGCQVVNDRTGEVVYTPPAGRDRILDMLNVLCGWLAAGDGVDPLIKMAAGHRQFEAIHPFPDGNGRTGRVLNILYLLQSGMLEMPVLYLSWYIVPSKSEYYERLRAVTEADAWEEWVLYMLRAIEETAVMTRAMLRSVRRAMDEAAEVARSGMRKGYSRDLLDLVFSQPYTRIGLVEAAGIARRNTASEYLRELERIGILAGTKVGRERLFFNPRLMEALTRKADGA